MVDNLTYQTSQGFTQSQSFFDPANPANKTALMPLQTSPSDPANAALDTTTGAFIPDVHEQSRLDHFPEDAYDLRDTSHLMRLLKALLGDSGAGQLRKRNALSMFENSLNSAHFYDLDRFYGAMFGAHRTSGEALAVNPYTDTATPDEWDMYHSSDAAYRERLLALAKAIPLGTTIPGMQAIAEAVTGVECDVYELWAVLDGSLPVGRPLDGPAPVTPPTSNREWNEVEVAFPTWGDTAGHTWQNIGNPSLALKMTASEPLGTPVTYTRTWANVSADYANWAAFPPDTWADVEGGTGSPPPAGTPTLDGSTAGADVTLTWNDPGGNVGYILTRNGHTIFLTGPASHNVSISVLSYTDTNTIGVNVYQVIPYTAVNSDGSLTYGTASNTFTAVSSNSGASGIVDPDEQNRSLIIVRPKKVYTTEESRIEEVYALLRVLNRVKPAGTIVKVDDGIEILDEVLLSNVASDSDFWEVQTTVAPRRTIRYPVAQVYPISAAQDDAGVLATDPHVVPRPAFTNAQARDISYNTDIVLVKSYAESSPGVVDQVDTADVVTHDDGSTTVYQASYGVMEPRTAEAARVASLVSAAPYSDNRRVVTTDV